MPYSIVFFGTHEFAATVLSGLLENPLFSVTLVITQPDRAVGRKKIITEPPVKTLAKTKGIPFLQPESLKNFVLPTDNRPDFGIVAQYGNLIPQIIIDWPIHGLLNTHTSLLPKYRGASPVQAAIMQGETETGLTIMCLDAGLDTGPILVQEKITIKPTDRSPDVEKQLAAIAVPNLVTAIQGLLSGSIIPRPQDNTQASTCGKLDRETGKIDWSKPAVELNNLFRALYPWPGTWTMWQNKRLKLLNITVAEKTIIPGRVLITDGRIFVGCGADSLEILELQLEGKTAVLAKDFIAGYPHFNESILA